MWNADHRLKESAIQSASLPCALLGWGGICQVKTVASIFWGAWNTDKENQLCRMRADLDHNSCDTLLRLSWDSKRHREFANLLLVLDIIIMFLRRLLAFNCKGKKMKWEMKTSLRKFTDIIFSHNIAVFYKSVLSSCFSVWPPPLYLYCIS